MIFGCLDEMQEYGETQECEESCTSVCYRGHTTGERSSVGDGTDLQEAGSSSNGSDSGLI